jgi:hypothetical protein
MSSVAAPRGIERLMVHVKCTTSARPRWWQRLVSRRALHSPVSLLTVALVVFFLLGSLPVRAGGTTTPQVIGLNCARARWAGLNKCTAIGTKVARVEFSIDFPVSTMAVFVKAFAAKGIKVQPEAGFYGRVPTTAEAQNLRTWALRFGPGGSFWQGRSDGYLAVTEIEFGNETSYPYQYGESGYWWTSSSYTSRARTYALRAKDAAVALQGTGVGLLVQADDAGSANSSWVDNMVAAVPNLDTYTSGWTIHPYGPGGFARIDRMLSYLGARGMSTSVPFYITEWGLASDNGRTLSDNYGYPTNMTYTDAAATLRDVISRWKSSYGSRFAQLILYQSLDQRAPYASTRGEHYFGVLRKNGAAKEPYTSVVRSLLGSEGDRGRRPR